MAHPNRHLPQLVVFAVLAVWALTGPFFDFSDGWKIAVGLGTIFVTLLLTIARQNTPLPRPALPSLGELDRLDDAELDRLEGELATLREALRRTRAHRATGRPSSPSLAGTRDA